MRTKQLIPLKTTGDLNSFFSPANKTINTSKNHRPPQFLLLPCGSRWNRALIWRGNKQAAHLPRPMRLRWEKRNAHNRPGGAHAGGAGGGIRGPHKKTAPVAVRRGWRRSGGGGHGETAAPSPTTGSASNKCKKGSVPATWVDFTIEI
jgi:hypothetical protein